MLSKDTLSKMGFFKRLVGKFSGSEFGKKLIGKSARAAHHVIGKVEHHYGNLKKSLPEGVRNGLNALENDMHFAKDTKASYAAAKSDLRHLSDHDKAYWGSSVPGNHYSMQKAY